MKEQKYDIYKYDTNNSKLLFFLFLIMFLIYIIVLAKEFN